MAGACVKLAANLLLFVLVLLGSVVLGQDLRPAPIETPHATEPHNILRPAEWTVAENLVPALSFTKLCQSHLSLTNLRDTPVKIEVEGHAQAGGLAPLIGHGSRVWIKPGETLQYSLQLEGDNEGAWIRVRERITSPDQGPATAAESLVLWPCSGTDRSDPLGGQYLAVAGAPGRLLLLRKLLHYSW
jgi:hypothetical protein